MAFECILEELKQFSSSRDVEEFIKGETEPIEGEFKEDLCD